MTQRDYEDFQFSMLRAKAIRNACDCVSEKALRQRLRSDSRFIAAWWLAAMVSLALVAGVAGMIAL